MLGNLLAKLHKPVFMWGIQRFERRIEQSKTREEALRAEEHWDVRLLGKLQLWVITTANKLGDMNV